MRQNRKADRHDLTRLKDRAQLERFIKAGLLVEITETSAYELSEHLGSMDPGHEELYRHARPWVKAFLDDVLAEGRRELGVRFTVTSLVRTKTYQKRLRRKNRNAIGGSAWWKQSSHLTGSTVDISYKDLDAKARKWLAARLKKLEKQGKVEAIMETHSACFHVMVFPEYAKKAKKKVRRKAR